MANGLQKKAIQFDKKSYGRFQKALKKAAKEMDDLRVPLNEVAKRFMEERKFIFDMTRSGPGAYEDLSPAYKEWKTKKKGSPYPILFLSGKLKNSITRQGGDNIKNVGMKTLELGSSVYYAEWLQMGTVKMPGREFLFWGPESPRFANHALVKKQNTAIATILFTYIERRAGKTLKASIDRSGRTVTKIFG